MEKQGKMALEHWVNQVTDKFIRNTIINDEFMEFMKENTLPYQSLMAYYRCAIMEI